MTYCHRCGYHLTLGTENYCPKCGIALLSSTVVDTGKDPHNNSNISSKRDEIHIGDVGRNVAGVGVSGTGLYVTYSSLMSDYITLNKFQKQTLVIKYYKQGKTIRQIAEIAHMSFKDTKI